MRVLRRLADHYLFVVQLRIVLIAELLELNDSTFEAINTSADPLNTSHTRARPLRRSADGTPARVLTKPVSCSCCLSVSRRSSHILFLLIVLN